MASAGPYRLTVRHGGRVLRTRHASLDDALRALRSEFGALAGQAPRATVKALTREFEPVAQVVARAALRGPGRMRAGVDLRGDGSSEAWTGRWQRQLVAQEAGEDAQDALRRVMP